MKRLIVILLLLTGCQQVQTANLSTSTPQPTETPKPQVTLTEQVTPTPSPTSTPEPEPELTNTPEPEAEPLTPQSIIDAWLSNDLEVAEVIALVAGDELPPGSISGFKFKIPECGDCGGKIIQFDDTEMMNLLADVWQSTGQHIAIVDDSILIQINASIDENLANQYLIE